MCHTSLLTLVLKCFHQGTSTLSKNKLILQDLEKTPWENESSKNFFRANSEVYSSFGSYLNRGTCFDTRSLCQNHLVHWPSRKMTLTYTHDPWPPGTPLRSRDMGRRSKDLCVSPCTRYVEIKKSPRTGTQILSLSPWCFEQGRAPGELGLQPEVLPEGFGIAPECLPLIEIQGKSWRSLTLDLHCPLFKAQGCCLLDPCSCILLAL